jgi:hypothetical protein
MIFKMFLPKKITQIWDFWFENKPSGKPGANPTTF